MSDPLPTSSAKPMRRDASRNHEAILSAAIGVLAASPQASMKEIADASGIGRTTLYRHFPDRRALTAAIYDRVFAEAVKITSRRLELAAGSDPVEVVADLSAELAGLGDRYRFLEQHLPERAVRDEEQLRHDSPLRAYLHDAQRRGAIRTDLDVEWLFEVIVALITHAAGQTRVGPQARGAMVRATVRSIVAPTGISPAPSPPTA